MPYLELLDRDTVLYNLNLARTSLEEGLALGEPISIDQEQPLTDEEIRELIDEIGRSLEQESFSNEDREPAYLPRDPIICGFQTGVEQYARRLQPRAEALDGTASRVLEEFMQLDEAPPLPAVTDQRLPLPPGVDVEMIEAHGRGLLGGIVRFPANLNAGGAIGAAAAYRAVHGPHDFNPEPATRELQPDARFYVKSDWASGFPRARFLSTRITRRLIADKKPERSHVIHLGDVYQTGDPSECRGNALACWPVPPGGEGLAHSWDLNGNHDMYSGGYGYFGTLLADPRFGQQRSGGQPTSTFELANKDWLVLGLDTALDPDRFALATSGGMEPSQCNWIMDSIRRAEGNRQKVVLLSHHQLFSAFDKPTMLQTKLGAFLQEHRVHAWFWGHEHGCTLYKPTAEVKHARCIGNGGATSTVKPLSTARQPDLVEFNFEGEFGHERFSGRPLLLFGFAILEFSGPNLQVRYVDERDNEWYVENI